MGPWDQGAAILRPMLASNPANVKANNLLGIALTGKHDLAEADRYFAKALAAQPSFYPARKNLAINQLELKQTVEAETNFQRVLAATPKDPVVNMYMGQLTFWRRDCNAAVRYLEAAGPWLEKDPRLAVMRAECEFALGHEDSATETLQRLSTAHLDPAWQFRAGYLLAKNERFPAAIRFLEAARQEYHGNYDVNFDLGLAYLKSKHSADAVKVLTEFRSHAQKTSELDNLLAEAYEDSGQTQAAIDTLREAIRLAPDDESNYLDLGMLCADHNSFDLGLEVVNVGLQRLPRSEALMIERGTIYAMSGKFELAEADFQSAGRSDIARDSAAAGLGLSYIQQGDTLQAIKTLRERIGKAPDNAALQYLLGESLIRSGVSAGSASFLQAQAALERSVQLNPNFVYSRVELAKLYLQQQEIEKAVGQLKAALAVDSTKVQVYAQLGAALRKQGKTQEANAMFARVRELNEYNRKHGQLASLVKGSPEQLSAR